MFDPQLSYNGHDACSGQSLQPDTQSVDGLVVAVFFCSSARLESEVRAHSTNIWDNNSTEFDPFSSLVVNKFLPSRAGHISPGTLAN